LTFGGLDDPEKNGARGAPFQLSCYEQTAKLAYPVHHFGRPPTQDRELWCTWGTVLAENVAKTQG
jgi:hypothetical protein